MANDSSNWLNKNTKDSKSSSLNPVKQRLQDLLAKVKPSNHMPLTEQGYHNPSKLNHQSSRPNPASDRVAYEKWYYELSPEEQYQEWQQYFNHPHVKSSSLHHLSHKQALEREAEAKFKAQDQPQFGGPGDEDRRQTMGELKDQIVKKMGDKSQVLKKPHFKPLYTAIIVGMVFLLLNFNELLIGQVKLYISPASQTVSPSIVDPNTAVAISADPRIIIPKINVDVPVVYTETSYDEKAIQAALEQGVVHYGTTAVPGQSGNVVIVGHSSNNFLNSGKYKFAFVLLDRLEAGDTFTMHFEGKRYVYKVFEKLVVEPDDFSVVQPTDKPIVTLITCTPPGTAWKRLAVRAEQIIPDPATVTQVSSDVPQSAEGPVPGNSPSLWDRFTDWIWIF